MCLPQPCPRLFCSLGSVTAHSTAREGRSLHTELLELLPKSVDADLESRKALTRGSTAPAWGTPLPSAHPALTGCQARKLTLPRKKNPSLQLQEGVSICKQALVPDFAVFSHCQLCLCNETTRLCFRCVCVKLILHRREITESFIGITVAKQNMTN